MSVETQSPNSSNTTEFQSSVPPDLKSVDSVTPGTSESRHKGPGRPPKPAPRRMGPHVPSRSRGYEISHRKKTQPEGSDELGYPSDVGAFLVERPDTEATKIAVQPKKEGDPIVISPSETPKELPGSPLETVAKESAPPQPSKDPKEAQLHDTAKTDETKGEKKPVIKAKRPSVATHELREKARTTELPTTTPETASTDVKDALPEEWKVKEGSVELPDGRRIVKNIATGETMIVQTKDVDGKELPAEQMKVASAKDGESDDAFLAREIPTLTKETIALVDAKISERSTENAAESKPKTSEPKAESPGANVESVEKPKAEKLAGLEKATVAEPQPDETKEEYIERRYGLETTEEYIDRLKDREIMKSGEKGALTRERNQIQKYLESLVAEGKDLPDDYLARFQDLNLTLDNAKDFRPGIEGKGKKWWSIPALRTEKLLVPTPVVGPPGPPVVEPPPPRPPVVEPPVLRPPVVEPPQPPPPGPPAVEPRVDEVLTLYALDARETDMAKARLLSDEQINTEMREIRERLFQPNNPSDNRFFRMVQTVARGVRSTFRHPVEAFRYVSRSTFLREAYRQRYIHEHFGTMEGPNFHNAVAEAVASRFDLGEDYLQNGEHILRENRPEVRATKDRLNQIFEQGITGAIDRASVITEAQRALAEAEWIGNGSDEHVHMVQNLEQIYDRITASVEHEAGLGAIDAAYRLAGGETELGVNAEANRTATDRIMERLTNSRLKGWLVNEATVAVAVGVVVNTVGYLARSKGAKIAAGALIGGPVGIVATAGSAALFSAARERMTLRQERALRMSQVASGEEGLANNPNQTPRTAEVDATLYDMVASTDVLAEYEALRPDDPSTTTEDEANNLRAWLVALRTNQTVGDEGDLDLIRYTSEDLIESEKTDLMTARAEAERILAQYATAHPDYMDAIPGASLEDKLNHIIQLNVEATIEGEISDADRAFRRLSASRAAKRAVATFAFASAGSYISSQISEHFSGERAAETITHERILPNQNVPYGFKGDSINMPEGWKLEGNAIIDAQGNKLVENIELRPDGGIPQTALDSLKGRGIGISEAVQNHTTTVTREVPFNEYMALHPEKFHAVHREMWMGNDTPMYRDALGQLRGADLNELGGDFQLDPNTGDIILQTNRMTDVGSFWGAVRVAAHTDQVDGKLRWLFSPDKGSQDSSLILEVEPGGSVVIPKGSEIHSLFNVNPQASGIDQVTLRTGFAEVAVPTGRSTAGAENFMILATQEGNQPPGVVTVTDNVNFQTVQTTLAVNEVTTEVIPGEDWHAPFIPIAAPLPRRPLERILPTRNPDITPYYGYNPNIDESDRRRWSPRLRNNPDIELEVDREVDDFMNRLTSSERSLAERQSQEIDTPMNTQCETVIAMPVAGHQEGENIYNTLRWYAGQLDRDGNPINPGTYEVVLYVNKPKNAEWDATPSEIDRFKSDFPDVPIRVVTREFEDGEFTIGRARREMLNTIMLRQRARNISGRDLNVVSHDADLRGIGRTYISTLAEDFEAQPVDGLSGRLDWGPDAYLASPLFHMGVKINQALDLVARHPLPQDHVAPEYSSSGNNFAFRLSSYAAVGGYRADMSLAEDVNLGSNIAASRAGGTRRAVGFSGGDNIVYTHPRRQIVVFNKGFAPAEAWSKLAWGSEDDEVRVQDNKPVESVGIDYDLLLSDLATERREEERRVFLGEVERLVERTLVERRVVDASGYPGGRVVPIVSKKVERALQALRITARVVIQDGEPRVTVTDASRLFEYLETFREVGLRQYITRTDVNELFEGGVGEILPEIGAAA